MARQSDVLKVYLPKWPAMTVVGRPLMDPAQVAEVMVRTTNWLHSCNSKDWEAKVWRLLGREQPLKYGDEWAAVQEVHETYKVLPLEYLDNSRIRSSWIGGPHGWLDWSGNVRCNNYNIGKWPSAVEVLNEWQLIAKTFPFLDLRCQLWSVEAGTAGNEEEGRPVVEFVVRNGKARACAPKKSLPFPTWAFEETGVRNIGLRDMGQGCTEETLREALSVTRERLAGSSLGWRLLLEGA